MCGHRNLHVLTHSIPTRRSSELTDMRRRSWVGAVEWRSRFYCLVPAPAFVALAECWFIPCRSGASIKHLTLNTSTGPVLIPQKVLEGSVIRFVGIRNTRNQTPTDCVQGCFESRHECAVLIISQSDSRSEEHTSELQSLMRISYAV